MFRVRSPGERGRGDTGFEDEVAELITSSSRVSRVSRWCSVRLSVQF